MAVLLCPAVRNEQLASQLSDLTLFCLLMGYGGAGKSVGSKAQASLSLQSCRGWMDFSKRAVERPKAHGGRATEASKDQLESKLA